NRRHPDLDEEKDINNKRSLILPSLALRISLFHLNYQTHLLATQLPKSETVALFNFLHLHFLGRLQLREYTKSEPESLSYFPSKSLLTAIGATTKHGCKYGYVDDAFQFVLDNGLSTEANYPYIDANYKDTDSPSICNTQTTTLVAVNIAGYEDVPANNESALLLAVAQQPVAVNIHGNGSDFLQYSGNLVVSIPVKNAAPASYRKTLPML
ncbi:hypothetical protein Ancab_005406, partial [Ancistrocladus abbreviatus]